MNVFNNVIANCPWVENNLINWFWSRFRLSLIFLEYVMFGISLWDKDIYVFIISIGLSLNTLFIWGLQKFFSIASPFPGCGEYLAFPSGFSQQIAFFYVTYFGCVVLRGSPLDSYRLHLISIWTVFTLYSLLYFPLNSHFQVFIGSLIGCAIGCVYLLLCIYVLFPNSDLLIKIKNKLKNLF